MSIAKPQPRKRVITGWRQLERRKAENRSRQRATHVLQQPKRVP